MKQYKDSKREALEQGMNAPPSSENLRKRERTVDNTATDLFNEEKRYESPLTKRRI